ncbi:semaphorin-4E-like [Myripristis murdjan]|uniref:semaphorin-4E-like n=1 Tax=Myripristis murdjan TaxID=586833 RepID=UPI001176251F|nr:semaphorin-4E-like [Myripristis murdjan]
MWGDNNKMKLFTFFILLLLIVSGENSLRKNPPRRSVPFYNVPMKKFSGAGFTNLSSMLAREDLGQLLVGGREMVLSLNMSDIGEMIGKTQWLVSPSARQNCLMEHGDIKECDNYIKSMHRTDDGNLYVCGTNAFSPSCDYMSFNNSHLVMENRRDFGTGKVPLDPNQRHTSLLVEDTLYSATYTDFWGTQPVFQKSGPKTLKTDSSGSWLNDPTFASMSLVETGANSEEGEDDSIFLFFTEKALERDRTLVSRVARVCKGDIGGRKALMSRWTSFLKARLDCPMGQGMLPSLVQDVYLLKDQHDWRNSVFYATFTSQSDSCSQSAVCAYKVSDIIRAFNGPFWSEYGSSPLEEELPYPRPGACINDAMRARGFQSSLDLPKETLQFVKENHLMATVVRPLTGGPLLVQSDTRFTKIVVDRVTALNGEEHPVMLIGTDSGWLQKAVKLNGEDGRVLEELQLFQAPHPIDFLQLSSSTGQLYTGFNDLIIQLNTRDCSRYKFCSDCVLARDPYCGWDMVQQRCTSVAGLQSGSVIQDIADGDVSMCPKSDIMLNTRPFDIPLTVGISQLLPCSVDSNLPVSWWYHGRIISPGPRHTVLKQGLLIEKPTKADAGLYSCHTMETVKGKPHYKMVFQYLLRVKKDQDLIYLLGPLVTAMFLTLLVLVTFTACVTFHRQRKAAALHYNISNSRHCIVDMGVNTECSQAEEEELVAEMEDASDCSNNDVVIEIPE